MLKVFFIKLELEEKKKVVIESFADKFIDVYPQQPISSSSTNGLNRYLCWNMIGNIIQRTEDSFKAIDINFSNIANKKKISFIDGNNLCLCVLNNCGAFFANKIEESEIDEYEKDDKRENAVIEFKTINNFSLLKNWTYTLPKDEV